MKFYLTTSQSVYKRPKYTLALKVMFLEENKVISVNFSVKVSRRCRDNKSSKLILHELVKHKLQQLGQISLFCFAWITLNFSFIFFENALLEFTVRFVNRGEKKLQEFKKIDCKAWFTYDRRRSQSIASCAIAIAGDRRNRTMFYIRAIGRDQMRTKFCDHGIGVCAIMLCFPSVQHYSSMIPWQPVVYQLLHVRVFWKDGR